MLNRRFWISFSLTLSLALALSAPAQAQTLPFTDVEADSWYSEDIVRVYQSGLMVGRASDRFEPEDSLSIAEAISITLRALNISAAPTHPADAWYSGALQSAQAADLLPNDGFGGDYLRPATRAETAYLLAQALEDNDAVVLNDVTAVIDVSTDSPYYDAILTLYRSGLAVGTDASGQFHPDSLLTRAEMAVLVNRLTTPALRIPNTPSEEAATLQAAFLQLVNETRSQAGLPALKTNSALEQAAARRAQEIAQTFSHTRPDGRSAFTIFEEFSLSPVYAAENILSGAQDAETALTLWLNSSGHRANILSAQTTATGLGIYQAPDGTLYWCQLFAHLP